MSRATASQPMHGGYPCACDLCSSHRLTSLLSWSACVHATVLQPTTCFPDWDWAGSGARKAVMLTCICLKQNPVSCRLTCLRRMCTLPSPAHPTILLPTAQQPRCGSRPCAMHACLVSCALPDFSRWLNSDHRSSSSSSCAYATRLTPPCTVLHQHWHLPAQLLPSYPPHAHRLHG
jgi:hypothetical protein